MLGLRIGWCALVLVPPQWTAGQQPGSPGDRIVTTEEVRVASRPGWLGPLQVISRPIEGLSTAMNHGLIAFERHRIRERMRAWQDKWRRRGFEFRFGGSGEGAGLGGGLTYTLRAGESNGLQILALGTFRMYEELGARWTTETRAGAVIAESSYQWRPRENFYGLGHDSAEQNHTSFALRQTWAGVRWEKRARSRLRWGALYRTAWLSALPGSGAAYSPPDTYFQNLAAYGTQTRLGTAGVYIDMDGIREPYRLGGAAHLGASYQHGLGGSRLQYFAYEAQLEGRLPVSAGTSAFVGQANFELNRERHGSDPIPFYLLPHIGGSSTLRGFALDRFYGRNVALLSLEYRYRIHPFIEAAPFFDEGQIFDRTADLSWLNWHRTYGLGFRLRSAAGPLVRLDLGKSSEGWVLHVSFGDRERPPLRGPFRYGAYKR